MEPLTQDRCLYTTLDGFVPTTFRTAIEAIVQDEFDDVAELASSFKVKEVRGIGLLEVARLFLDKTDPGRK